MNIKKTFIMLGITTLISSNLLLARDDLNLSDKEKQKIIEERDKTTKAKNIAMKSLNEEKHMVDVKYSFMMNCLQDVATVNDIKECNESLKNELKKEEEIKKEEEKKLDEYEKRQEKIKSDNEKAEAKRLKDLEKAEAKKQKELGNDDSKK